ncbi:hypothetical protein [Flavobacterium selenitireducens]|uniref:hypothetical protein n=1 Tax=Flavobacterium selenitireducens TaxID=2722704 RepID=UPI00168A7C9C|nr:hypothetical protein [Flavobacterium selenitireducens]MBD3581375.1 hypothetical protein [Flavobacterium selenitireducens]
MKKILLLTALLLGAYVTVQAQEKPKKRPVTEKPKSTATVKAEPTPEGQASRQKAAEDIKRSRAEKRAKMEETRKNVRDRIATDTTSSSRK